VKVALKDTVLLFFRFAFCKYLISSGGGALLQM
jgi:hypothetical protein